MALGALVVVIVGILIVNYFKDKGNTLTGLDTQKQSAKEHVVVKGETLWSIAEDSYGSGYNWTDLKSANKLKSESIEIGQKLTLPDVSAKKPTVTKVTATVTAQNEVSANSYTVAKGDSLWKVAVMAYGDGYKWVSIAKANKLSNPNLIHAGNVLTLPR